MHARTAATPVLLALTLALTGCSSGSDTKPDAVACKTAMQKQFKDALKAGETAAPGSRPDACDGVDAATLRKIAGELVTDQLDDAAPTLDPADELEASLDALEDEIDDTLKDNGITPTP